MTISAKPKKDINPVFCHQDYIEFLSRNEDTPFGKRAQVLLQRLAVDAGWQTYKTTKGSNCGWRRSGLGGHNGSHFYAWWAPHHAAPLKDGPFENVPAGSFFVRAVRHHDNHDDLSAGLLDDYLPMGLNVLQERDYEPWTCAQREFAKSAASIRFLKGHPGSGKTSALWHSVVTSGAKNVLYVTYSESLASIALKYFDRFCEHGQNVRVYTYPMLLKQLLGRTDIEGSNWHLGERERFVDALYQLPPRVLGPWTDNREALYDEIYAHLIGDALPRDCEHGREMGIGTRLPGRCRSGFGPEGHTDIREGSANSSGIFFKPTVCMGSIQKAFSHLSRS
jgi:hypothetical protein